MNNINDNIYRLDMFQKYIKMNYEDHAKKAKESDRLDEIENSIYCIRDYADVLQEIVNVIDKYAEKTGYEG